MCACQLLSMLIATCLDWFINVILHGSTLTLRWHTHPCCAHPSVVQQRSPTKLPHVATMPDRILIDTMAAAAMMHMPYVTSDTYVSRAGLLHIAAAMVTLFYNVSCDDGCIQHSRHCPLLLVLDAEPPWSRGAGGVGRSLRQPYATRICARCI